mgnify:CR=1 FL=1
MHTNERIWDVILVTQTTLGSASTPVTLYSPLNADTQLTDFAHGYISTAIKGWKAAPVWYMSDGTTEPVNQNEFLALHKLKTIEKQQLRRTRAEHVHAFNTWAMENLVRTLLERTLRGCKADLKVFNRAMRQIIEKGKQQMAACDNWIASPTLVQDFHAAAKQIMHNPMFPSEYLRNVTSY